MILLDTHAWVWWLNRDRKLKASTKRLIAEADAIAISPVSIYEVANAVRRDRLELSLPIERWLAYALEADVVVLPLEPSVAAVAGSIDWPHGDPCDRIIVATAMHHGIPLVTADQKISSSKLVEVMW